jgi:hypothetical protein
MFDPVNYVVLCHGCGHQGIEKSERCPKCDQKSSRLILTDVGLLLVELCRDFYEGEWENLIRDLRRREQEGHFQPMCARIRDDLGRIQKLRTFEEGYGVSLISISRPSFEGLGDLV